MDSKEKLDPCNLEECPLGPKGGIEELNVDRCSADLMGKLLTIVNVLKDDMVEFVPIPVLNNNDRLELTNMLTTRLRILEEAANAVEEAQIEGEPHV
jgi:hypothetical protein|tara:strand:- start:407 stop:697 length:291 start_codon:yes stop_codon:yes gene_type:complete